MSGGYKHPRRVAVGRLTDEARAEMAQQAYELWQGGRTTFREVGKKLGISDSFAGVLARMHRSKLNALAREAETQCPDPSAEKANPIEPRDQQPEWMRDKKALEALEMMALTMEECFNKFGTQHLSASFFEVYGRACLTSIAMRQAILDNV